MNSMLWPAIVCCLVFVLSNVISKYFLVNIAWSPLFLCPMVGMFCGKIQEGIVLGGYLQAIFLGVIGIGGVTPANKQIGSIVPAAFVFFGGMEMEAGLAIAYSIGVLANSLNRLGTPVYAGLETHWKKLAEEANPRKYSAYHLFYTWFFAYFFNLIIIFFAVYLGTDAVKLLLDKLPAKVLTGLQASTTMMTAVGISIAMKGVWEPKYVPFFFIGWVMSKILGMASLPCAIVAFCVGILWYVVSNDIDKKTASGVTSTAQRGGDFF